MLLNADPQALAPTYQGAHPFPHIVLDGLFESPLLSRIVELFPSPADLEWVTFDNSLEKKLGYHHRNEERLPHEIRDFLYAMNSPAMLLFLQELTGIKGLIPDPYFGGGGLHQIERGGFLKVHADFNWHPLLRLDRRLNMLIYLNENWPEEYGGHLELWDATGKKSEKRILPSFNRTVIFSTTDRSFHGHPLPLSCPQGRTRKSISLYYYTNGRPEEERSAPHDTIFVE